MNEMNLEVSGCERSGTSLGVSGGFGSSSLEEESGAPLRGPQGEGS